MTLCLPPPTEFVHVHVVLPNSTMVNWLHHGRLLTADESALGMGDNRVGEISEISRSLKALAKEMHVSCDCPLSQL